MLSKLPPSRTENIVIQSLESELLIYDLVTNKAFCLNENSAIVYQACDGKTSFADLKHKHNLTDEIIFLALDGFKKENLLDESFVSPLKGIKRRDVIKKIGLATVAALPIIVTITAPTVAMAASCSGTMAAGSALGCTVLESQCLNMNQTCASCSTTAVLDNTGVTCPVAGQFICICN